MICLEQLVAFSMSESTSILRLGELPELTFQDLALPASEYLVGWFSIDLINFINFLEVQIEFY